VDTPKVLDMPGWLPETASGTWGRIVDGLQKAGVSLEAIDAEAVAFYVLCVDGAREATERNDSKMVARFCRDAIAWGNLIGASPAARLRMAIPAQKATAEDDPWPHWRNKDDNRSTH